MRRRQLRVISHYLQVCLRVPHCCIQNRRIIAAPPPEEPIYITTMICCLGMIKCGKEMKSGDVFFYHAAEPNARAARGVHVVSPQRPRRLTGAGLKFHLPYLSRVSSFFCALHLITAPTPLHCLLLTPNERPAGQRLPSPHHCQMQTDCSNATISIFSADPSNIHLLPLSLAPAPVSCAISSSHTPLVEFCLSFCDVFIAWCITQVHKYNEYVIYLCYVFMLYI